MTESFSDPPASQSDAEQSPRRWTISASEAGMRLDLFLAGHDTQFSRTFIRNQIVAGRVLVDDHGAKVAYRLHEGQIVTALPFEHVADSPEPEDIPLDILYEDEDFAVVNKAAGMVVHPAKGHWSGTLTSALTFHFQSLSSVGGATRPGIVHRLDRDTSGVILVAKNNGAHQNLAAQFEARTVEKEYWAIVQKIPDRDRDQINFPIGPHPHHREKMVTGPAVRGKAAETFYEVLERFSNTAVVRVVPKTGRTHQIRVHLAHLGHPVLCDRLYGSTAQLVAGDLGGGASREEVVLDRQALHARKISVAHPSSGERISFEAPLASDLQTTLEYLQKRES